MELNLDNVFDDVLEDSEQLQPTETIEETEELEEVAEVVEETQEELPDKFKKSPLEVYKSYAELQKFNTRTTQENAELRRQLKEIEESGSRRTETGFNSDEFLEQFTSNPEETINRILESKINPVVNEIKSKQAEQERQTAENQLIADFFTSKTDAKNYVEGMIQFLAENPQYDNDPHKHEVAYNAVKLAELEKVSPDAMLDSQEFIDRMLNSPKFKAEYEKKILTQLKNNKTPPTINSSGASPTTPPKTINKDNVWDSIKEDLLKG